MQSICTPHYLYKSLQYCCGSKFGTDLNLTDGATLGVISEERDNRKAPLSTFHSEAIHSDAIQPELHTTVLRTSVLYTSVLYTAVRKAGGDSCLSDSNIPMNYLASSVVASVPVDCLVEFREKVGRTTSDPTWH
jgi:hypothetical protein